jgi:DNA-binding GntR family transcriptional regulator
MTVGSGLLRSQSLVELVVSKLREDILSGALVPGERLVEEQLTREFGISRAPLREALRLLGEQGLVEHLPRRGARVTSYSERDVDELFEVRDALERLAAGRLAGRALRKSELGVLADTLAQLDAAASSGDRLAASSAHRAFHLAAVALADSRQLMASYEPVIMKLQLHMAANLRREADQNSPAEGVRRHRALYNALVSGDPERIRGELDRHGARRYFH